MVARIRNLFARFGRIQGLALGGGIGGLVAIQLIAAFLVQIVVLRIVGAGRMTDAFIAAQTIPLIAASIMGTALQNIWQPRLAVAETPAWKAEVGRALTMTLFVVVPIAAILFVVAPIAMGWLFVGFSAEQAELTATLTRINLIAMIFNIAALIIAAGGRAQGRFLIVELVPAATAVVTVGCIAISVNQAGVLGATWTLAARAVVAFAIIWLALGAPIPCDPRDERLGSTMRAVFALMGGSSFYKLGPLVDRFWASQAPTGHLTLFNLAQTGMGAIASLLERALALPLVPALSRAIKAGDYQEVRRLYLSALLRVWGAVAAVAIGSALIILPLHPTISSLLSITEPQALFLVYTGFALLGFLGVAAGGIVINSAFFAMGDVRTPISVGTAGFFLGLVIKSIAFVSSGLLAMAFGTSVYYIATMIVMISILERRLKRHENA